MFQKYSLLGGDTQGTRNREGQQGLGLEGGVKKDERNKSFHKQALFLLGFSLGSDILFYFIFYYMLKLISWLEKNSSMIM